MVMRLFAAALATETDTFSPLPTGLASYPDTVFLPPGAHPADATRRCTAPLFVARRRAHSGGFTLLDSDAPLSRDDRQIEYVKVNRPIWPLDENTRPGLIF
jgi:microcystin degradation protein MlrC